MRRECQFFFGGAGSTSERARKFLYDPSMPPASALKPFSAWSPHFFSSRTSGTFTEVFQSPPTNTASIIIIIQLSWAPLALALASSPPQTHTHTSHSSTRTHTPHTRLLKLSRLTRRSWIDPQPICVAGAARRASKKSLGSMSGERNGFGSPVSSPPKAASASSSDVSEKIATVTY